MMVRNLTPHPVTIVAGGAEVTLRPDGPPPRVETTRRARGSVRIGTADVPVYRLTTGNVVDLPEATPGVLLIVSQVVAAAARRPDLLFPVDLLRSADGAVVGCQALGGM